MQVSTACTIDRRQSDRTERMTHCRGCTRHPPDTFRHRHSITRVTTHKNRATTHKRRLTRRCGITNEPTLLVSSRRSPPDTRLNSSNMSIVRKVRACINNNAPALRWDTTNKLLQEVKCRLQVIRDRRVATTPRRRRCTTMTRTIWQDEVLTDKTTNSTWFLRRLMLYLYLDSGLFERPLPHILVVTLR